MAISARKWKCLFVNFSVIILLFKPSDGTRTKQKIYKDLDTTNACFRALNATHQVGCSSKIAGNVGVLHYIETEDDYDWVLKTGPHPPYVVLMNSLEFNSTNVDRLASSERVTGLLVINVLENETLTPLPTEFSADKTCPNDAYGLYHSNSTYGNCKQKTWNPAGTPVGMMFKDYDIPMFSIPNITDVHKLLEDCYEKFNRPVNGIARGYPLCAAQLSESMVAAVDTITCTRRTNHITNLSNQVRYCDPLGDKNIVVSVKTTNSTVERQNKSVIVVATRMDSFSMFHNEYPSADTTVTGIVTLMAAVEAMSAVKEEIAKMEEAKDILFVFFQGEAFDYIGSSRVVYDMEAGKFPQAAEDKVTSLQTVNLTNIHSFIELSQVGLRDEGQLWIHTDPISKVKVNVSDQIQAMVASLTSIGAGHGVELGEVTGDTPLPPASVQRFLMKRADIPALVITDHKGPYTNKFFNSRFDIPSLINVTNMTGVNNPDAEDVDEQTKSLTKVATTLARFLYTLATGKNASDSIAADQAKVEDLLQCFLYNPHCEMFRRSVHPDDASSLEKARKPFPFYVSVDQNTNQVTTLTRSLLAQFFGEEVQLDKNSCKQQDNNKVYEYLWIQGVVSNTTGKRDGICVKSTTYLTTAKSPAFDEDGYDWKSGKFSTWTESVWDPLKVRVFLVPSQQIQTTTLSLGVIIMLVSLLTVYFINKQSDIIFCSQPSVNRYYTY